MRGITFWNADPTLFRLLGDSSTWDMCCIVPKECTQCEDKDILVAHSLGLEFYTENPSTTLNRRGNATCCSVVTAVHGQCHCYDYRYHIVLSLLLGQFLANYQIQWNLSETTSQNIKKKWSFQTGGHSRKVQFAWIPLADRNFQELDMVFPERVVFP